MGQSPPVTTRTADQNRLQVFARAFKGYLGVMPIVTAALAPLLTFLRALPTYESQRTTLATLSGILGFLLLAWIFYVRRTIALGSLVRGFRFIINMIPFLLVVGTVISFVYYIQVLRQSTDQALVQAQSSHWKFLIKDQATDFATTSDVLRHWDDRAIPCSTQLQLLYLGIFLFPECAFVLMALREYINDALEFSEIEWMFGKQDSAWLQKLQDRVQPVSDTIGASDSQSKLR